MKVAEFSFFQKSLYHKRQAKTIPFLVYCRTFFYVSIGVLKFDTVHGIFEFEIFKLLVVLRANIGFDLVLEEIVVMGEVLEIQHIPPTVIVDINQQRIDSWEKKRFQ